MKSILIASHNMEACEVIRQCLQSEYRFDVAASLDEGLEIFRKKRCEFFFVDLDILCENAASDADETDYKSAMMPFWQAFPAAQIVAMSSQEKIRDAVMAVKAGASNYITYPIDTDELTHIVENAYKTILVNSELNYLRDRFWQADSMEVVETTSPAMRDVFEKIRAVGPMKTTVLLAGETGTGKSLLAKLIHRNSSRRTAQFIHVHCGAIPDTLIESELFGHEKGAFTGADRRKLGKFEIAHKGTIFLDEVSTLTPAAQIKLLQVLQEQMFQRVGGESNIEVDVRIIAATNIDLSILIGEDKFRRDLYYRLSVFPIEIPPLRERDEDLPHLAEVILRELKRVNAKDVKGIDPRVIEAFKHYSWPGNVRELKNIMERAFVIEKSSILSPESFPRELFGQNSHDSHSIIDIRLSLSDIRNEIVKTYLVKLLAHHRGRIRDSASAAGITTRQLNKLMIKYGIKKEEFKLQRID